jgi:Uma2 family endonuclease
MDLAIVLSTRAKRLGLEVWGDSTGVFGPGENWRIPDLTFARPDQSSERGLESAELVVETLSPNDESRKKLPFYASIGVREVWLVHPTTRVAEMLALVDGDYVELTTGESLVLGVRLETVDGPKLRVHDGDSFTDV